MGGSVDEVLLSGEGGAVGLIKPNFWQSDAVEGNLVPWLAKDELVSESTKTPHIWQVRTLADSTAQLLPDQGWMLKLNWVLS
jgi:hypothetical protein